MMNHFRKSRALLAGSGSRAGAAKIDGRSIQQSGISVMDFWARRKGGERVLDRSPLMEERIFAQSISYSRENIVLRFAHYRLTAISSLNLEVFSILLGINPRQAITLIEHEILFYSHSTLLYDPAPGHFIFLSLAFLVGDVEWNCQKIEWWVKVRQEATSAFKLHALSRYGLLFQQCCRK